jgi:hypothetical protein
MSSPGSGPIVRLEDEPVLAVHAPQAGVVSTGAPGPGSGAVVRLEDEPVSWLSVGSPSASGSRRRASSALALPARVPNRSAAAVLSSRGLPWGTALFGAGMWFHRRVVRLSAAKAPSPPDG